MSMTPVRYRVGLCAPVAAAAARQVAEEIVATVAGE